MQRRNFGGTKRAGDGAGQSQEVDFPSSIAALPLRRSDSRNEKERLSGCEVAAVMQPTQSLHRDHTAPGSCIRSRDPAGGHFFAKAEMRPVVVIVANVVSQEALQVALAEYN